MTIGRTLFASAAAALGVIGLHWGAFAKFWQPIPPGFPGYTPLAYLTGLLLLIGGFGALYDRTARLAGWMLAIVYAGFAVPWAIRVVRYPQLFGTWGGFAEEFALLLAAVIVAETRKPPRDIAPFDLKRLCILAYGICAVAFGLNHFFALEQTAGMVPKWIPPGRMFWAVATGVFHAAAGIAILVSFRARLAATLLGTMMLGFSAFVWLPNLVASPGEHITWAGNAVNLALAGSAFVVADALTRRRRAAPAATTPGEGLQ